MRRAVAVLAFLGCGRVGFDPATRDGAATEDAPQPDAAIAAGCGPAYAALEGLPSRYRHQASPLGWVAAQAACEADGGHLVVIDTEAERAYVAAQSRNNTLWIGYSDTVREATFVSVFGEPPLFPAFNPPEPNDTSGNEDCIEIRDESWNDQDCLDPLPAICECDGRALPAEPPWCNTSEDASCGECAIACPAGASCVAQLCQ